jgi:DnaJ like chaperone protein
MSIWGRLAAATEEISPGATLVHVLFGGGEQSRDPGRNQDNTHENALPFTAGMIALGAKMAKSDGVITRDEVSAFRKAFNVSDGEMREVARVFNLAKQDSTGYEACADQLVNVLKGDRKLLDYVLEGLFHIATVDGVLHPREEEFLQQVANRFGVTDAEFGSMKARYIGAAERNPYEVLGLKPSVSNEELKSQYQRLIAESQPDQVMARGMPEEFARIPTAKLAAIKGAYETIARERDLS